jgi:hypothetical protein
MHCIIASPASYPFLSPLAPFPLSRHYTPHYIPLYREFRVHRMGIYLVDVNLVPGKVYKLQTYYYITPTLFVS